MASLVYRGLAHRAPVTLLPETPQELLAERAECRLTEELRHEPVPIHFMDPEIKEGFDKNYRFKAFDISP